MPIPECPPIAASNAPNKLEKPQSNICAGCLLLRMRQKRITPISPRVNIMPALKGLHQPCPKLKRVITWHMKRKCRIYPRITGPLNGIEKVLNKESLKVTLASWPTVTACRQRLLLRRTKDHRRQGFPSFLLEVPLKDRCILWDESKVGRTRHLRASLKGNRPRGDKYLEVSVGKDRKKKPIWVSAHVTCGLGILWTHAGR